MIHNCEMNFILSSTASQLCGMSHYMLFNSDIAGLILWLNCQILHRMTMPLYIFMGKH